MYGVDYESAIELVRLEGCEDDKKGNEKGKEKEQDKNGKDKAALAEGPNKSTPTTSGASSSHETSEINHSSSPTIQTLLAHVNVNAIADYYQIPALKTLAIAKIQDIFDKRWQKEGFLDVVEAAFTVTGDAALQKVVLAALTSHIGALLTLKDFSRVFVVGERMIEVLTDLHKSSVDARTLKQENARLSALKTNLENLVSSIDRRGHCCQCRATFGLYINRDVFSVVTGRPEYNLKCSKCHAKN